MIHLLIALALAAPDLDRCVDRVTDVMERWSWVPVEVDITVRSCGYENAWYIPSERSITMCSELCRDADLAGFVLSHEMGHALMWQFDVPQRRGTHDQERVADEIAALMSTTDEVYAAARWFLSKGVRDDSEMEHPSPHKRAGSLLCLAMGRDGEDELCERMYESVLSHWVRIFDGYMPELQ